MESNLKSLASLAKQRLKQGNYSREVIRSAEKNRAKASDYFYQNMLSMKKKNYVAEFVKINPNDDQKLIRKIYAILDSDEYLLSPIGKLVDNEYFSMLNDIEKQHYILKLCDKFNKVKEDYLQQKIG